jgi:hypothetical protein
MKKRSAFQFLLFSFVVSVCFSAVHFDVSAEETVQQAVVNSMPVLKGDQWLTMDENAKVAFIWGVAHVVTIEEVIMEKYPDQKRDTFVTKIVEASSKSPMTMNQVVAAIDKFYADNPDKTGTPVMMVIWDTLVKPNIKTGIAGKPLK